MKDIGCAGILGVMRYSLPVIYVSNAVLQSPDVRVLSLLFLENTGR